MANLKTLAALLTVTSCMTATGIASAQTALQPSPPTANISGLPTQSRLSPMTDQLPYDVGKGPKLGPYYLIRSEDSLQSLFPPDHKPDFFDPLKDIKLDPNGFAYIILNYDQRVRYEYYGVPQFDFKRPVHQSVVSLREELGADVHLGDNVRFYGSLESGEVGGKNFGVPNAANRDDLTVLQGFTEVQGMVDGANLGVRAGRQEMVLGNGSLFAARDNTNIHQNYDGVRTYADWKTFRVDGFFMENVVNHGGVFHDDSTPHQQYWGLYGSWRTPAKANIFMDPFYIGYYNRTASMDGLTGSEARSMFGDRLWGVAGPVDFDWTGIYQTGSQAEHDVSAYEVVTDTGFNFRNWVLKPRLGLHLDLATGGRASDGTVKTFEPLNFSSIYYSEAPLLAPMNLMDAGVGLSASVLPQVRVQGIFSGFWKYSTNDFVYNFVNAPYKNTNTSRSTFIGVQPAIRVSWIINRHLSLVNQLAYFDAGPALTEAHGKSQDYFSSYALFRF